MNEIGICFEFGMFINNVCQCNQQEVFYCKGVTQLKDVSQRMGYEKKGKTIAERNEKKKHFHCEKKSIMSGALFKSEFAYHFPSLKSNQFPSDNMFCSWLNDWSNNWHISICTQRMSLSRTLPRHFLVHNSDSNWHTEMVMMVSCVIRGGI